MANYNICPICKEPVKVENYAEHFAKHGTKKETTDLTLLRNILDEAKKICTLKGKDDLVSLQFEVAKRVFSEVEKIDTTNFDYVLDSEYPDLFSKVKISVPSPHPPIMCTFRYEIKDKTLFEKVLKKYEGTPKEQILKDMVSRRTPTVMVFRKEYAKNVIEWKSKGMKDADILIMTVFFFLHEMYHIIGFGEKDSDIKASITIYKIFDQLIGIPEHEIERWKYEEEHRS